MLSSLDPRTAPPDWVVIHRLLGFGFAISANADALCVTLARPDVLGLSCTTPEAFDWLVRWRVTSSIVLDLNPRVYFYRCAIDWEIAVGLGWTNRIRRLGFQIFRQGAALTVPWDIAAGVWRWPWVDGMPPFDPGELP